MTWLAGQTYYLQVWYEDIFSQCGSAFNLTNAVQLTITP